MNTSTKHEFLFGLKLENLKVLDMGCGDASIWVKVLEFNPKCMLFLYDPDPRVIERAQQAFSDLNLKATFSSDLSSLHKQKFDIITCFAVLEHVFDLRDFFKNVKIFLSLNGTAYINYDDGHFRSYLYRTRSRAFRIRNWLKTRSWFLWKGIGWYSKYQKPVNAGELVRVIEKSGLKFISDRYHSIDSLEQVSGQLTLSSREQLFPILLELEEKLNSQLSRVPNKNLRGHSDLFTIFNSRTLILKNAD